MTTFLVILLIAALIAIVVLVALWQSTVVALVKEKASGDKSHEALMTLVKERQDGDSRYEKVISAMKAEIASLEGDLSACKSPDVVRARLRSLLSGPTAVSPAASSPGGVPPGATPV